MERVTNPYAMSILSLGYVLPFLRLLRLHQVNVVCISFTIKIDFTLTLIDYLDEEISVVRSISYLTNDQVGECHIYLDDDHTIGLNRYQLTEYESFSPFSTDEMTGEKNALSFCIPAGNFILGQRRRTQEAIANDFVQILKDISFI